MAESNAAAVNCAEEQKEEDVMEVQRDKGIRRPTWRELLLLLPFAFSYAFFIVLGDWQKSPFTTLYALTAGSLATR